jgi:tRNA dimethylallyltransferase
MIGASTILIAGPTASGKSALAASLARTLGGVVINADSMQVYRELRILTAAPTAKERSLAPHRLFAFQPAARAFSVAAWLARAEREARVAWKNGRVAIFTGGTGLYFRGLLEGLAAVPAIPPAIRQDVRDRMAAEGVAALYRELQKRDPAMAARLKPNDRQRILRALEVMRASGTSLRVWQRQTGKGLLAGRRVLKICLTLPRPVLEQRIRKRFGQMLDAGALAEARHLRGKNLAHELPAMKALGVRPLLRHVEGTLGLSQALEQTVIESRRYAKRQMTWFRNQFPDWEFVAAEPDPTPHVLALTRKAFRAAPKRPIRRAKAHR